MTFRKKAPVLVLVRVSPVVGGGLGGPWALRVAPPGAVHSASGAVPRRGNPHRPLATGSTCIEPHQPPLQGMAC